MQQGGMFASGMVFPEYSSQVLESGKTWSQWLTMSFANPEHEREYKKWSWEKNRRRWILMSMALMGWTMLLYVQYIVIGLVSQSRGCNSFTTAYCPDETDIPSMRYIWKWDVGFLFVGGILPFAIILMAYIRMSRETMSYWAGPLFTFFVGGAVNLNVLVRTRVVDPDGDFWNFGLLNLVAIIIIPILANLPSFLTMLFVMSNLIIMIALNTGRFNTRKSLAGPAVLTYVCLSAVTTIIATRLLEVIERDQFAVTYGMNRINRGLRDRLQGLQRQLSSQAADFDSPLEKSIATVKSIMANPVTDRNTFEHLEKVLGWLSNSDKLFTPALENQLHAGVAGVDEEQEVRGPGAICQILQPAHQTFTSSCGF
ncbi:hypothetical protein HKX48_007898 [Thoreauomyces humboldtii]|nr:hypothetical protein HKX48_007898 [Thoreauomyces humboldtii]